MNLAKYVVFTARETKLRSKRPHLFMSNEHTRELEVPDRVWLTRKEVSGHPTWIQASGHDDGEYEYVRASVVAPHYAVGLNLLRQLVGGKNALRTLGVFPCNQAEHEDVDCKCFWEQCEAWAKQDAAPSSPVSPSPTPEQKHLCPRCGRRMQSAFDEDAGMWYECENCDYREAVSNAPTPEQDSESRDLWAKMELLKQRFESATTHDEVAALVWACRALIDADADEAPFFTPEAQDRMMVYSAALSLYFEHAQRVLGRSPLPIEVDEVETGFCDPRLEALKPERMERGRQLLATITAPPCTQPSARAEIDTSALDEVLEYGRTSEPETYAEQFVDAYNDAATADNDNCAWTLDDSMDGDLWETGCGETFQFTDGGPVDNKFVFCYKCGKQIDPGKYSDSVSVEGESE